MDVVKHQLTSLLMEVTEEAVQEAIQGVLAAERSREVAGGQPAGPRQGRVEVLAPGGGELPIPHARTRAALAAAATAEAVDWTMPNRRYWVFS